MLTAGVACYRAWLAEAGRAGGRGRPLAGRVQRAGGRRCADAADAVPLVRFRAQAMQAAVPVGAGAMVAILGLEADAVRRLRQAAPTSASRVGGQLQRSQADRDRRHQGRRGAACEVLKAAGAKRALPLAVSAPFHCALMKPAADAWPSAGGRDHRRPRIRWSTTSTWRSRPTPMRIRDALYRQAYGPVRWVEVVQALRARGHAHGRVRSGQGAVAHGQAHRSRPAGGAVFDPASLAENQGAAVMSELRSTGRARHRRLARHRPRHRGHAGGSRATRSSAPPPAKPAPRHHRGAGATRGSGVCLDVNDGAAVDAAIDGHRQAARRPARAGQQRRHHARRPVDAHARRRLGRGARHQPEGRVPLPAAPPCAR
jgi:[acyl-carrier-protein] S-malonyltransferase